MSSTEKGWIEISKKKPPVLKNVLFAYNESRHKESGISLTKCIGVARTLR